MHCTYSIIEQYFNNLRNHNRLLTTNTVAFWHYIVKKPSPVNITVTLSKVMTLFRLQNLTLMTISTDISHDYNAILIDLLYF